MGKTAGITKRTALITGGSSGIGLATALELAKLGYELMICGRRQDTLADAVEQLQAAGAVVHHVQCDVSRASDVSAMVASAMELWGHLDILFNNAGTGESVSLSQTTDELWETTIGSSLTGTFNCCRALIPLLLEAPAPIIVNNASVAAQRGFPDFAAYSAAKGGVAAFSRAIREEFRPTGLRVTTLFAGATDSNFWDNVQGEWDRHRMMGCQDVGQLIAFIAQSRTCATMEEVHLMPAGGAL